MEIRQQAEILYYLILMYRSELIKSIEIGTEMRFLNNRVGFDLAWYKSNATRQLIDLPMDPQSGYSAKKINAGDIQNTGY